MSLLNRYNDSTAGAWRCRRCALASGLWLLLGWSAALAQPCGSLRNDIGPYDYSAPSSQIPTRSGDSLLAQVEQRYFRRDVENLSRRGRDGKLDLPSLVASLDATLRVPTSTGRPAPATSRTRASTAACFAAAEAKTRVGSASRRDGRCGGTTTTCSP